MTKADLAKKKGMSKFDPFQGADGARIRMGNQLVAAPAQTESIQAPSVCTIGQSCEQSGQWTIKAGDPKKQEGFTICMPDKKNSCLCFTPEDGLSVRTASGSAAVGTCGQWVLAPGSIGKDGEIKGYTIRPKGHTDHVLVLDEQTNQVQIVKEEELAKNKKLRKEWTFDTGKKSNTVRSSNPKVEKN